MKAIESLKQVKRSRLIAAAVTALLTLWCMWWLYDQEFHYANTDAGRLSAVEDYVRLPEDSHSVVGIAHDTPVRVVSYAEHGRTLYIYYAADNADNVHGILCLKKGINFKYQPVSYSQSPFPYTAGVTGQNVPNTSNKDEKLFAIAGDGCDDISAFKLEFSVAEMYSDKAKNYEKTFEVTEPDFLWLLDRSELEQELGIPTDATLRFMTEEIYLLDQDGNDVTEQYRDESVRQSWGGGGGSAELFMLYIFIGIVALLGLVIVRYFLTDEKQAEEKPQQDLI